MDSQHPAMNVGALADFENHRIEGFATHGGQFSVPLFSQIEGNLWMGGCPVIAPPKEFEFVVSLYPWGDYSLHLHQLTLRWALYDSKDQPLDRERLLAVAGMVKKFMAMGPTLVHCQAGLNRSGLITALTLMLHGMTAQAAIDMLREKRCSEVLCNKHFEEWLRVEGHRLRTGKVEVPNA